MLLSLPHRLHYEISLEPASTAQTPMSMSCQYSQFGASPSGPSSPNAASESAMKVGPPCSGGGVTGLSGGGGGVGFFASTPPHHGMAGLPQPPRQKGRPRKRKPKDIEAMASNLGECSSILSLLSNGNCCFVFVHLFGLIIPLALFHNKQ